MTDGVYIGVDVGTTGARAVLIDASGCYLASADEPYGVDSPRPGYAESNPEEWYRAVCRAVSRVAPSSGGRHISGLGLTGQMHGLCALDADGQLLYPAILWCDTRSDLECRRLEAMLGRARLIALSGNAALPAFTAGKFMWLAENRRDVVKRISHILLPKDYIRYRLTGEFLTEPSDASGTQLFDTRTGVWSDELCDAAGVDPAWLPWCVPSDTFSSVISPSAAAACGLPSGVPLCGGASDNAASALALGDVSHGDGFISIGSSGIVALRSDRFVTDGDIGRVNTFRSATGGVGWDVMSTSQAAGLSLRWFAACFYGGTGGDVYERICAEAERSIPGAGGVTFLPYLMGDRTPHMDASARGAFVGLSAATSRGDMARALLEGVAFSLKEGHDILKELIVPSGALTLCGGGAKSRLWRQIVTDVLASPTSLAPANSAAGAAAYGAVCLCLIAGGEYPNAASLASVLGMRGETLEPSLNADIYSELYLKYQSLYPALHPAHGRDEMRGEPGGGN